MKDDTQTNSARGGYVKREGLKQTLVHSDGLALQHSNAEKILRGVDVSTRALQPNMLNESEARVQTHQQAQETSNGKGIRAESQLARFSNTERIH